MKRWVKTNETTCFLAESLTVQLYRVTGRGTHMRGGVGDGFRWVGLGGLTKEASSAWVPYGGGWLGGRVPWGPHTSQGCSAQPQAGLAPGAVEHHMSKFTPLRRRQKRRPERSRHHSGGGIPELAWRAVPWAKPPALSRPRASARQLLPPATWVPRSGAVILTLVLLSACLGGSRGRDSWLPSRMGLLFLPHGRGGRMETCT